MTALLLQGIARLDIAPQQLGWVRADRRWTYTTIENIVRYYEFRRIDDDAARRWQAQGVQLHMPPPTLTVRRTDGSAWTWDPKTKSWKAQRAN